MNPTKAQLEAWASFHNVIIERVQDHIEALCIHPVSKEVIARIAFNWKPSKPGSVTVYELACNAIAREICIVPPRIALSLNPPPIP